MSLDESISQMIKEAMKSRDTIRLDTLRAIKSAIILNKTKAGATKDLSENNEALLLKKLVKQRKESAEIFKKQNRFDLAESEEAQANIIEDFLPKQLDQYEIEEIIKQIISNLNAEGMKDMGKVMGSANKIMAGKADGKKIAEIVKKFLS